MGGRRAEWGRPPASGHCRRRGQQCEGWHPAYAGCGPVGAERAVPRAPRDAAAAGSRAAKGGTGGRSGTPPTPGAGPPWLVAQFPAPLRDASAAGGFVLRGVAP
ncbi:hypothetical protein GCM10010243_15130 [Streptomyces matensis]|nr:hypothetical protein GCM10010243_15130 [Streptomyces matensis]